MSAKIFIACLLCISYYVNKSSSTTPFKTHYNRYFSVCPLMEKDKRLMETS